MHISNDVANEYSPNVSKKTTAKHINENKLTETK